MGLKTIYMLIKELFVHYRSSIYAVIAFLSSYLISRHFDIFVLFFQKNEDFCHLSKAISAHH